MKKKIFAMLCASLLISFSAVACDSTEEPQTPNCSAHLDADNNGYCDNCKIGVIKLVETTPAQPEDYKEMVVNAIPEGGKLTDFVKLYNEEDNAIFAGGTKTELEKFSNLNANSYLVSNLKVFDETNSSYTDTYTLYNTVSGEKIYEFVSKAYINENEYYLYKERVDIYATNNYYFRVVEHRYDEVHLNYNKATTTLYDYSGKKIAEAEGVVEPYRSQYAGYYYVNFDGKVYGFDTEEKTLVVKGENPNFFVARPDFDVVIGEKGYILSADKVFVYDISKWLETSFVYTIPSYLANATINVLSNGNILVQGYKSLTNNAVNYDVTMGGAKYDVVQYVVNPADGSEKALEFGYVITEFAGPNDIELVKENTNAVVICPIVNKEVDYNKQIMAIIDGDLNILCAYKPAVIGQSEDIPDALSANRFLSSIVYGDGTESKIIVDENGALVTYLPNSAEFVYNYIKMDNKIYDYDLNEKLDLKDLTVVRTFANGAMILSEVIESVEIVGEEEVPTIVTKYYYYNVNAEDKVEIIGENEVLYNNTNNYYVVEKTTLEPAPVEEGEEPEVQPATEGEEAEENMVEVKTYSVYNYNNELVATFDAPITSIELVCDGVYKVVSNGKTFLLKK